MILESKYQLYRKNKSQELTIQILMGKVFFFRSVVVSRFNQEVIPIERTDNKNRERPDAHHRHGISSQNKSNSNLTLVDKRDFEWLAWNYRTYKSETKFVSKKDMVAQMYNKTFSFLPTGNEILYGIILAQVDQI